MNALVGDRLVIRSNRVGQPAHEGVITEVLGGAFGREIYRVRWADGRETVMSPGADAAVEHTGGSHPPGRETRTVTIEMRLEEDSAHCDAVATMRTSLATFVGEGRARRHPDDPAMPMIGEELAIARSLTDLAEQLERAAREAIARREERPRHLVP